MEQYGLTCNSYALAYYLKKDCKEFVRDKLGLDVFSENTDEKKIFREMLVWYADIKRKQSDGRYWIEKVQADMEKDPSDVVFVTDIRFDSYPKDEVYWIKNELGGKLIHVSKYSWGFPPDGRRIRSDVADTDQKIWVEPANDQERLNDPKVKAAANLRISWSHIKSNEKTYDQIVNDEYLNSLVGKMYEHLFNKKYEM